MILGCLTALVGAVPASAQPSSRSELQEILPPADAAEFGQSVAISGQTAVIGNQSSLGTGTGAAYVFVRSRDGWTEQAELLASDGTSNDSFGWSVAISAATIVVGAPFGPNNSGRGAAYVFTRSGTIWTQQAKLTASDAANGDEFGFAVGLQRQTLVIGAQLQNNDAGAVYVFQGSGDTWTQTDEFHGPPLARFGNAVAISGSSFIVGALEANSATGAAYVYVRSGDTWEEQATLLASDGAADDQFGTSVALENGTAVVGAPVKDSSTGAAYVFVRADDIWSQQQELLASDAKEDQSFGSAVAVQGPTMVVGALQHKDLSGAAYVFASFGQEWSPTAMLQASDHAVGDRFGTSVAIGGRAVLVGAPYKGPFTAGAAYAFAAP